MSLTLASKYFQLSRYILLIHDANNDQFCCMKKNRNSILTTINETARGMAYRNTYIQTSWKNIK